MTKVRLVATKVGFYKGNRIRVGQEFDYEPVEGVKEPSWAAPAGTKVPAPKPLGGDTKPKAAQTARDQKPSGPNPADTRPPETQKASVDKQNAAKGLA